MSERKRLYPCTRKSVYPYSDPDEKIFRNAAGLMRDAVEEGDDFYYRKASVYSFHKAREIKGRVYEKFPAHVCIDNGKWLECFSYNELISKTACVKINGKRINVYEAVSK